MIWFHVQGAVWPLEDTIGTSTHFTCQLKHECVMMSDFQTQIFSVFFNLLIKFGLMPHRHDRVRRPAVQRLGSSLGRGSAELGQVTARLQLLWRMGKKTGKLQELSSAFYQMLVVHWIRTVAAFFSPACILSARVTDSLDPWQGCQLSGLGLLQSTAGSHHQLFSTAC